MFSHRVLVAGVMNQDLTTEVSRLAVATKFWPLFEIENGKWVLTPVREKDARPLEDFLKLQGRFAHLLKPGNEALIQELKDDIDANWAYLEGRVAGSAYL